MSKKRKSKPKKQISRGRAYIKATYNNTVVSITDSAGNVLGWSSAGKCGFRGPKQATPYAASIIVKDAIENLDNYKINDVDVFVKGVGMGKESAIRSLYSNGLNILSIKDTTPVPHNGCRPPKSRRV